MTKIKLLGEVAQYNEQLDQWQSSNQQFENALNNAMRSFGFGVSECIQYFVLHYGASLDDSNDPPEQT